MRGKVALITGSGRRRLGNVVAHALANWGCHVAIHYHRSDDEAQTTVDELRAAGVQAEAFGADVGDEGQVEHMFHAVTERFGRLDILVTTASVWRAVRLESMTAEDVTDNFRVDALGTFLCARRGGLIMARQPEGGAIITFGDWSVHRPYLDHVAYFMAKGAIIALTQALAVELAQRNPRVRVNCILPGPVMFPAELTATERAEAIESTLVRNADCPESVALAVRFLIENQFVTGVCLPVDGGRSIYAGEAAARRAAT